MKKYDYFSLDIKEINDFKVIHIQMGKFDINIYQYKNNDVFWQLDEIIEKHNPLVIKLPFFNKIKLIDLNHSYRCKDVNK
jgi:hypothetical protein